MIPALFRALSDLVDPALRRVLFRSVGLALLALVALWAAVGLVIERTTFFNYWLFDRAVDVLGGIATLALSWLLFPAVVTLVMSFFLDGVIAAIEARHYPGLPPARPQPLGETVGGALRLTALAVLLNLLALPFYVFIPAANLLLFYTLNGYLLGREYFELVALRRFEAAPAKALRRANAGMVFLAGVAAAFLLSVPVLNLAAPLFAASLMVHLFQRLRAGALITSH